MIAFLNTDSTRHQHSYPHRPAGGFFFALSPPDLSSLLAQPSVTVHKLSFITQHIKREPISLAIRDVFQKVLRFPRVPLMFVATDSWLAAETTHFLTKMSNVHSSLQ